MILRPPTRRGAALLLALAALLISATAAVSLVRLAATARTQHNFDAATLAAHDLLSAAEFPIHHWLTNESASVVLPPDNIEPRVPILHDTWTTGTTNYELQITAWDLCGMVPLTLLSPGSPLRLALPPEILSALDQSDLRRHETPGLDFLILSSGQQLKIFPTPNSSIPVFFGDPMIPSETRVNSETSPPDDAVALGALVATHTRISDNKESPFKNPQNPEETGVRLNVNTAPVKILKATLRSIQRGGLEQILKSREEGEPASVPDVPPANSPSSARAIVPAGESDSWAFRIDASVGAVHQSWWAVYIAHSSSDSWQCVQRLIIHE